MILITLGRAGRAFAASAAGRRVDAEVAPQRLRGGEGQEQREGDGDPPGPVPVRFLLHGASFCFAARAVVAVLSLHQGGAVRPYRRRRRRIPCSNFFKFRNHSDDTRAYSKDLGIKLEEPEKLKISLK